MLSQEMLDIRNQTEKDFTYKPDGKVDFWQVHKKDGPFVGDCEDFALTLLYRLSGKSMFKFWLNLITFRAVLWHCKTKSGSGHLILWYKGGHWADNTMRSWYRELSMPHMLLFPWPWPFLPLKMLIGKVFTKGS